jgi:RNA polymerase sigma-54 factor
MRLELGMSMRPELRMKLAPQIIQSIEILQLPLLELSNRIEAELLENPMLERAEEEADDERPATTDDGAEQVEEPAEEPESDPDPWETQDHSAFEEMLVRYEDIDRGGSGVRNDGEKDPKLAALENSPAGDISLEDHLHSQLTFMDPDDDTLLLCENIIANLDWRGYLEHPVEEIVASIRERAFTAADGERALAVVQGLEPQGVGARSLEECLLLQLDPRRPTYDLLRRVVENCMDDVVQNRWPRVVGVLGCTMDELKSAIEELGALNPIPGALFNEPPAPHVIPDVEIEKVEGEYRVMLENTALPSLRVCAYYARRLQQKDLDPKTEEYLRGKLQAARWLIDAIQQRRSTLFNISTAIVEAQTEFLDKGAMHLKPMKMQEIADKVGVHVSTVSRAISGKYAQTPRGVRSLKSFFTGGLATQDGESESWEVVRTMLLKVVEEEDKSKPLSDDALAGALGEKGVDIARRTVSKYRKLLGIPSSRRRREY